MSVLVLTGLAACGGVDSVETAAEGLNAPTTFTEVDAETLDGFEETQRVLTFTTDLSQSDACSAGRAALEQWADQRAPEASAALPLTWCSIELANPANHQDIDYAAVHVERARVDGEFVDDENQAGGVARVVIFFATNK